MALSTVVIVVNCRRGQGGAPSQAAALLTPGALNAVAAEARGLSVKKLIKCKTADSTMFIFHLLLR
eukprot:scaffold30426_cov61-Skeletonema_dohrnii-CCMP3373.AAC.2